MIDFFKGIKILNGEKGINIIKNVAMEAYVELASKADVKAALNLDSKRVDDRIIHSKFCGTKVFFCPVESNFDALLIIQNSFCGGIQRYWRYCITYFEDKSKQGCPNQRITMGGR